MRIPVLRLASIVNRDFHQAKVTQRAREHSLEQLADQTSERLQKTMGVYSPQNPRGRERRSHTCRPCLCCNHVCSACLTTTPASPTSLLKRHPVITERLAQLWRLSTNFFSSNRVLAIVSLEK